MGQNNNANFKEAIIKVHILEGRAWYKDYILLEAIIVMVVLFTIMNPQFIGINNIFAIMRQASITGLLALGLNIIVIVGGFDLSIAAIANFAAVISITFLMNDFTNLLVIWVTSILVGVTLSFINSLFVIYVGVPCFIATLGMSVFATGIARPLTFGGLTTFPGSLPPGFTILGKYDIANLIPVSVLIFVFIAILVLIVVEYTPFGRKLYAVGNNPDASKHVGIQVNKTKIIAFLIAGLLYGIAGIVMSSMFGSCSAEMASGYFMPALISVFLGAAYLSLGHPNIRGTIVSVFLLVVIVNGCSMINLPFYLKHVIQGLILILAIGIKSVRKVRITPTSDIDDEKSIK